MAKVRYHCELVNPGMVFGEWTVLEPARKIEEKRTSGYFSRCRCACGTVRDVRTIDLLRGYSRHCGKKHGGTNTKLHGVWKAMKSRCFNPNRRYYENYGGRGITVCDEWNKSFQVFQEWATANGYQEGLFIDRIDNSKGYCPENCRWVDRLTNNNNSRKNVFVTAFGETKTLSQWSRDSRCAVNHQALGARIRKGWNPELAITTLPQPGIAPPPQSD